jgi:hypothetical protein
MGVVFASSECASAHSTAGEIGAQRAPSILLSDEFQKNSIEKANLSLSYG